MNMRTSMRSAASDNDLLHWATILTTGSACSTTTRSADLMIKVRTAYLFMVPTIRKRHVSGLRPDRRTTYCDDGPRQWFAKDVPGAQPLPFAQLQIGDEDNNPVQRGEAGRDRAKKATAERHRSPRGQWQSLQTRPCRRHGDLGRAAAVRRGVREGRSVVTEKELVELCSVHQDSGRQDRAQGTSRAVPGC